MLKPPDDKPTGSRTILTAAEYLELSAQQRTVYDYLITGRGLSNLLALTNHSIGSLSSRIAELRAMELDIRSDTRVNPVSGKRYTVYRLKQEEVDESQ